MEGTELPPQFLFFLREKDKTNSLDLHHLTLRFVCPGYKVMADTKMQQQNLGLTLSSDL